jgi:hypothetical protein
MTGLSSDSEEALMSQVDGRSGHLLMSRTGEAGHCLALHHHLLTGTEEASMAETEPLLLGSTGEVEMTGTEAGTGTLLMTGGALAPFTTTTGMAGSKEAEAYHRRSMTGMTGIESGSVTETEAGMEVAGTGIVRERGTVQGTGREMQAVAGTGKGKGIEAGTRTEIEIEIETGEGIAGSEAAGMRGIEGEMTEGAEAAVRRHAALRSQQRRLHLPTLRMRLSWCAA